ncbi:D-alanine--D-alanine ligase [Streptomyces sp. PBH53]|nr:D-alanine--D-alanine ligase [Streptomyces sp. PBH53]
MDAARIGVLCGGTSPERPGSLASGQAATQALTDAGLKAEMIDLAEVPVTDLAGQIDLALLALHGLGGEDGKIQGTLDTLGIPYTGSGVLASALGMYKPTFKTLLKAHGIDTPAWTVLGAAQSVASAVARVEQQISDWPIFFKPCSGGGSLVAGIAHDRADLESLLSAARSEPYEQYMVEEYIDGMPCTVGVLEIDGDLTTLPVLGVETQRDFYDYEAKHDLSQRTEHCPAPLPATQLQEMRATALNVHRLLGAHGVSRVDFMAGEGRTAVLEINTIPGLSVKGNLAAMSRAAGISYPEMVRHVLRTATTKPAYVP